MLEYLWLVPFFPLLGLLLNGFLGWGRSERLVGWVASGAVGLSFLTVLFLLWELLQLPPDQRLIEQLLYTWVPVGDLQAAIGFQLDPLSMVMTLVVTGVAFLIHVYSIGYMHGDRGYVRYFVYLNLFTLSMLLLVLANNFLLLFLGWEGVGLCSYLLIGYWYEKKSATDAGVKAFLVNRIGDFGFLIGILLVYTTFGTLDFTDVFAAAPTTLMVGSATATAITLLLFAGAVGKSAQLPLYVWLPDAMEGPTPVSALIHAATMVTAGVYMVARTHVLFELAPFSMEVVAVIGAVTALFAAAIGLVQHDIKRVLAYSTISQLGYMFLGLGVGAFSAGIFHLMTHAFFKALLFMGAGSVMHALSGELNLQKMGGLRAQLPTTYRTFLMGGLAIAGIFPFAGFFSKDEILWETSIRGHFLLWAIGSAAAWLTALYIFRMVFLAFHGEPRVDPRVEPYIHEAPPVMAWPLRILAVLSLVGGWVGLPLVEGGHRFRDFLAPVLGPGEAASHPASQEFSLMSLSLGLAVLGIALAYRFYVRLPELPERVASRLSGPYRALAGNYPDRFYWATVVWPVRRLAHWLWVRVDDRIIDGLVNGVGDWARGLGALLRRFQTGYVSSYAISMTLGVLAILAYYVLR